MFFLGSGSSILPYLISLALIWGVFLLNGILDTTLKREIRKNAGMVYEEKNTSQPLKKNTCSYERPLKTAHHSGKNPEWLFDYLHSALKPVKFHFPHIRYSYNQSVSCSFLRRGPPVCIFPSQV